MQGARRGCGGLARLRVRPWARGGRRRFPLRAQGPRWLTQPSARPTGRQGGGTGAHLAFRFRSRLPGVGEGFRFPSVPFQARLSAPVSGADVRFISQMSPGTQTPRSTQTSCSVQLLLETKLGL